MTWEWAAQYVGQPLAVALISGLALIGAARMTKRSQKEVTENSKRQVDLNVMQVTVQTLQTQYDRLDQQSKATQSELAEERIKGREYRLKVDQLEHERDRIEYLLDVATGHLALLEDHIVQRLPPPAPPRPLAIVRWLQSKTSPNST